MIKQMSKMDFSTYINQLEESDRENGTNMLEVYAERSGTSVGYIKAHLKHRYKIPRQELMRALAENSDGAFSYEDLVRWFYQLVA